MTEPADIVYRYAYSSKRDGQRYIARVTIHERIVDTETVLLLLRAVGRWPDREDLIALTDAAAAKGVPVCSGIILTLDEGHAWRTANLTPEGDRWAAA